jgi:hypothetical protein
MPALDGRKRRGFGMLRPRRYAGPWPTGKPAIGQAMANEPELPWGEGRFTPAFPRLMELFAAAYPTAPGS